MFYASLTAILFSIYFTKTLQTNKWNKTVLIDTGASSSKTKLNTNRNKVTRLSTSMATKKFIQKMTFIANRRTNSLNPIDELFIPVINKQTNILEKFAKLLQIEHSSLRSKKDFENLLKDLEARTTSTTGKQTSTTSAKRMKRQSTVLMVDETAVRDALGRDPLVKRILQMAKMKRAKYVEEAKRYFSKN